MQHILNRQLRTSSEQLWSRKVTSMKQKIYTPIFFVSIRQAAEAINNKYSYMSLGYWL